LLEAVGFKIISNEDIPTVWDYPDTSIALKGLLAVGPAGAAIAYSGLQNVQDTVLRAVQPYIQANGHVVYHNKFRIVIARR